MKKEDAADASNCQLLVASIVRHMLARVLAELQGESRHGHSSSLAVSRQYDAHACVCVHITQTFFLPQPGRSQDVAFRLDDASDLSLPKCAQLTVSPTAKSLTCDKLIRYCIIPAVFRRSSALHSKIVAVEVALQTPARARLTVQPRSHQYVCCHGLGQRSSNLGVHASVSA